MFDDPPKQVHHKCSFMVVISFAQFSRRSRMIDIYSRESDASLEFLHSFEERATSFHTSHDHASECN